MNRTVKDGLLLLAVLFLMGNCSQETIETVPAQNADFCHLIHQNDSNTLDQSLALIADSLKDRSAAVVLEDGGNAMMARAWLCEHAQKSIEVQYLFLQPIM